MTQAPTPGPLDMDAAVRALHEALGGNGWAYSNYGGDELNSERTELEAGVRAVISLAPTAPVEASGSERDVQGLVRPDAMAGRRWRHKERGTTYTSLGFGKAQCSPSGLLDDENVVIYQGDDGSLWARRHAEFTDGRFEEIQNLRPQPSGETREQMMGGGDVIALVDPSRWDCPNAPQLSYANGWNDAVSARPLALGGQHSSGEDAAWSWLNRHVECDPADRDYSADEMVDAFMAGAGRYDIWLKALERIAGEQQHRSGYCQTDITVEPALTAEEAQTVARAALSTTPARAEAQDEGAAGEPVAWFRQSKQNPDAWYQIFDEEREHYGAKGSRILALRDAHPSPTHAADEDRVRIAVEALEPFAAFVKFERALIEKSPTFPLRPDDTVFVRWAGAFGSSAVVATYGHLRRAAKALAALKSEGRS